MKKNKGWNKGMFLIFASGYTLLSIVIFLPLIRYHLSDSAAFIILAGLLIIIFYMYSCFTEISTSIFDGLYGYFSRAYSRLIGFHFSLFLILGITALILYRLQTFFLEINVGSIQSGILAFIALVVISSVAMLFGSRILFFSATAGLLAVLVLSYHTIYIEDSFFVFGNVSDFHPETLIIYLIVMLVIALFPILYFINKLEDPIEILPDVTKVLRLVFFVGIVLLGFILVRSEDISSPFPVDGFIVFTYQPGVMHILSLLLFLVLFLPSLPPQIRMYSKAGILPKSLLKGSAPSYIFSLSLVFAIIMSSFFLDHLLVFAIIIQVLVTTFILFIAGILILRLRMPDLERPYQVKFYKYMPPLITVFLALIISQWVGFDIELKKAAVLNAAFFLMSSAVFFIHTYYHDEKMHSLIESFFWPFLGFFRRLTMPMHVRKALFDNLGDIEGKIAYEYGCKNGTITFSLLDKVGVKGAMLASDKSKFLISRLEKEIVKTQIRESGYKIKTFVDKPSSMNPGIPKIQVFVSAGTIGFVSDIDHFLKELNMIMENQGKIVVAGLSRLFFFFPIKWLCYPSDITNTFIRTGFLVKVEHRHSLLGTYSIISGTKYQPANMLESWYYKEDINRMRMTKVSKSR